MPVYAYLLVAVAFVAWMTPFVLAKGARGPAQKLDKRARWGMLVQGVGYVIVTFGGGAWMKTFPVWRLALGIFFLALAAVFSWQGTRALGKQWRLDAGLNADHELVRSGPYRLVRHPIYASMLFFFLGLGFMMAPLWRFVLGLAVFLAGTQIRVRLEDSLLSARFGERFEIYRKQTPAYIPFLKLQGHADSTPLI